MRISPPPASGLNVTTLWTCDNIHCMNVKHVTAKYNEHIVDRVDLDTDSSCRFGRQKVS